MYLRHHRVENVKLLRDVEIPFVGADGNHRMWTVFVGENRLCKTTLLQTIAAAASGIDRGTQLVTNVVASWPDLRNPVPLSIETTFGFSDARHGARAYPGLPMKPAKAPHLISRLALEPDKRVFNGGSSYDGLSSAVSDPLTDAWIKDRRDWSLTGSELYGPFFEIRERRRLNVERPAP